MATGSEEPSCSYSTPHCSNTDARIKTKITSLNQTFVRIINSLKIMNVRNRNSGREGLNSNGEMISLFDNFLNISHLLNIKINYLYNTYVSRSEMKQYISSINYKLYVFNINSFELSQEIDKGHGKHKKYQILHDLNVSEMTNNVKLFNYVDDVEVEPPGQLDEEEKDISSCSNDGRCTSGEEHKKLKRKTDVHCDTTDQCTVDDSLLSGDSKKLKTSNDLDDSDSVEMYNNLFKEINNNIVELSREIDELSALLRSQTQSEQALSPGSSNEEEEEEEGIVDATSKAAANVGRKLRKWQMKQMTRALIENMVNGIQEEFRSRAATRNERSLVNEAVLMAIQSIGLQREGREEDGTDTPPPEPTVGQRPLLEPRVPALYTNLQIGTGPQSCVLEIHKKSHTDDSDEIPIKESQDVSFTENSISSSSNKTEEKVPQPHTKSSAEENTKNPEYSSRESSVSETPVASGTGLESMQQPEGDTYYDDDFLARAVSVAISKKGLST